MISRILQFQEVIITSDTGPSYKLPIVPGAVVVTRGVGGHCYAYGLVEPAPPEATNQTTMPVIAFLWDGGDGWYAVAASAEVMVRIDPDEKGFTPEDYEKTAEFSVWPCKDKGKLAIPSGTGPEDPRPRLTKPVTVEEIPL